MPQSLLRLAHIHDINHLYNCTLVLTQNPEKAILIHFFEELKNGCFKISEEEKQQKQHIYIL